MACKMPYDIQTCFKNLSEEYSNQEYKLSIIKNNHRKKDDYRKQTQIELHEHIRRNIDKLKLHIGRLNNRYFANNTSLTKQQCSSTLNISNELRKVELQTKEMTNMYEQSKSEIREMLKDYDKCQNSKKASRKIKKNTKPTGNNSCLGGNSDDSTIYDTSTLGPNPLGFGFHSSNQNNVQNTIHTSKNNLSNSDKAYIFNQEPFKMVFDAKGYDKCMGCNCRILQNYDDNNDDLVSILCLSHKEVIPRDKRMENYFRRKNMDQPALSQYYHAKLKCLLDRSFTIAYLNQSKCDVSGLKILNETDRKQILEILLKCKFMECNIVFKSADDFMFGKGPNSPNPSKPVKSLSNMDTKIKSPVCMGASNFNNPYFRLCIFPFIKSMTVEVCGGCHDKILVSSSCIVYGISNSDGNYEYTNVFHLNPNCLKRKFENINYLKKIPCHVDDNVNVNPNVLVQCGFGNIKLNTAVLKMSKPAINPQNAAKLGSQQNQKKLHMIRQPQSQNLTNKALSKQGYNENHVNFNMKNESAVISNNERSNDSSSKTDKTDFINVFVIKIGEISKCFGCNRKIDETSFALYFESNNKMMHMSKTCFRLAKYTFTEINKFKYIANSPESKKRLHDAGLLIQID